MEDLANKNNQESPSALFYDPNHAGRHDHKHRVQVRIQQWEYSKTYEIEVFCLNSGVDVLETAIEKIVDALINEDGGPPEIVMSSEAGDELGYDLADIMGDCPDLYIDNVLDAFRDMVVAVEIINLEKIAD